MSTEVKNAPKMFNNEPDGSSSVSNGSSSVANAGVATTVQIDNVNMEISCSCTIL